MEHRVIYQLEVMWCQFAILSIISVFMLFLLAHLSQPSAFVYRSRSDSIDMSISSVNGKSDDPINLGFSTLELKQAKSKEMQTSQTYDITALLLHWKRMDGLKKTLQYILDTNLFSKIIIWNNNPQIILTHRHLTNNSRATKRLRIINSNQNLKDEAKYRACAIATTKACFYVDDDWDVSRYIRSLIASFRADPHLLHAVTDAYTFYTNLIWSYVDEAIDLHTGFSWIGCGSLFLRAHAERHLQLLHKYLKNQTGLLHFSDVFFSVWLNDVPSQMNANIRYQPSKRTKGFVPFSSTARFGELQYQSSILAIRILQQALRFERTKTQKSVTFSRQAKARFPVYVKSPSANDDLIFFSNIVPFDVYAIRFNISKDFERATRRNLPRDPNTRYVSSHSSWKAVDTDLSTCWYAHRDLREDDFFALDFLRVEQDVQFTLAIAHSSIMQMTLNVDISFDGVRWISYRGLQGRFIKENRTSEDYLHTYLFDSARFPSGFNAFRYLRFQAIEASDHRFQICEIQKIDKAMMKNLMQHFRPVTP